MRIGGRCQFFTVLVGLFALFCCAGAVEGQSQRAQEAGARAEGARADLEKRVGAAAGETAASFKPDEQVEVREGDEWSKATFLKREGRKLQVRYDDGTEEWVTADRVRAVGAGGAGPAGPGHADGKAAPQAKKLVKDQFAVGARVEVKDSATWRPAVIKNRDGDLYLIEFEKPWQGWTQWVHPWIIRKVGSAKEWHDWGRGINARHDVVKSKQEAKRAFANIDAEAEAAARGEKKDPFAPVAYDKPITDVNLVKVEELVLGGGPAKLAVFDAAPATKRLAERAYVLNGADDKGMSSGPSIVLFAGSRAVAVYTEGRTSDTRTTKIGVIDLSNGKSAGIVEPDPLSVPCDISETGERLAGIQPGFHSGTRVRVDVHKLKPGSKLEHVVSFVPNPSDKFGKDVEFARFVGESDERLLTVSNGGTMILWDVPKVAAIWRTELPRGAMPALSPGRKQIAFLNDGALVVVDALTGKALCRVDSDRTARSLSFSSDGKRVVGVSGWSVCGWDLENGKALPDIGLPAKGAGGSAIALDSRFVLIGGSDLLDLDKRIIVWRYNTFFGGAASMHGGLVWRVLSDDNRRSILAGARLPHDAARKAADAVAEGEGLLLRPGGSVALSVAIEAPPEQQQRVVEAMTAQLKQAGIQVDPNSPIKLNARTEQGKTTEQAYRDVRQPFGEVTKVSVTEKVTRCWLEVDGKVGWETRTSSGGAPMFVRRQEGQDVNDAVNAAVQASSKFNIAFLESVRVPAYVMQPSDAPFLGESSWGVTGITKDRINPNPPRGAAVVVPPPAATGDGLD